MLNATGLDPSTIGPAYGAIGIAIADCGAMPVAVAELLKVIVDLGEISSGIQPIDDQALAVEVERGYARVGRASLVQMPVIVRSPNPTPCGMQTTGPSSWSFCAGSPDRSPRLMFVPPVPVVGRIGQREDAGGAGSCRGSSA